MTTPCPNTLRIDTEPDGTMRVVGDLDVATAGHLRAALAEALTTGAHRLVLDVSTLDFCDSSGLAVLVQARNDLPTSGQLVLHGASDRLRRLLQITHLEDSFTLT